jgi:nucleotide-binding universal stress UspA family protein
MEHEPVVLVGIDGSETGAVAAEWAAREAVKLGWRLHVVCAYSLPTFTVASLDGGYAALDDSAIRAGAQAVLDKAVEQLAREGLEITSSLETGDAAGVLVELSRNAGLAVIGTRGKGGFADRLLGTVSSALPAHAHCPTVVVPVREEHDVLGPIRRIVVGMDGSESAKIALARAIDEAEMWGVELTAVAGVPMVSGSSALSAWLPASTDREAILAEVQAGLDAAVEAAAAGRDVVVKRHALDGSGAALLTEFSTAVELIVVGTRGRGGFAGLLLGSTSQTLLHHAVCPIMVVPSRVKDEGLPPTAVGRRRP